MWTRTYNGTSWTGWQSLGGYLTSNTSGVSTPGAL
jgi:hypothetical protein